MAKIGCIFYDGLYIPTHKIEIKKFGAEIQYIVQIQNVLKKEQTKNFFIEFIKYHNRYIKKGVNEPDGTLNQIYSAVIYTLRKKKKKKDLYSNSYSVVLGCGSSFCDFSLPLYFEKKWNHNFKILYKLKFVIIFYLKHCSDRFSKELPIYSNRILFTCGGYPSNLSNAESNKTDSIISMCLIRHGTLQHFL